MARKTMEAVAIYIRQCADREVDLAELAQKFHYSPSHLSRTFKKKNGLFYQTIPRSS